LNKYDTYIFGSSRIGKIPNEEVKNAKVYNFNYSGGLPHEHLNNIKYLIKKKANIKTIIIGIDDFSFYDSPNALIHILLLMSHPSTINKNKFIFLTKYIVCDRHPFKKYDPKQNNDYDLFNSGRPKAPQGFIEQIEKDKDKYFKDKKFKKPCEHTLVYREETINELTEIKSVCQKNNIKLILFINPLHHKTYLYNNIKEFNRFKRELVKISPFWDFAYLNSITTDNYYFYETSHYRELVGRMILERLGYLKTKTAHKDFGKYITPDNIDSHIKFLENNYKNYKWFKYKNTNIVGAN